MTLKKLFSFVALMAMSVVAMAQMPSVPVDNAVRIGKLPNGLTYYIRYNNWPENRAEFYIAQKVGSLQEEEEQRGLAHFLEHMCFNGTNHFPGDNLLRYCESIGVKFGRDLNAYTSIDQTVYNISNVPTTRQSALDSCLLILHDWADGLTLDPTEIDKERGVIHEEWRMRTSASTRMFERNLPMLYPNSKYGLRMPIGLMSVIDNFKYQVLRDYYEKWYRPDNQGIIVVGDVDVDHIEAEIKRLFSDIKMPENPAPVVHEAVPDNTEPIIIIDKDKEQDMNIVELEVKFDVIPDSLKNTPDYMVIEYLKNTAVSMLNDRLNELSQKAECPFAVAQANVGNYIFARTKGCFTVYALPKDGKAEETLSAIYREVLRLTKHGFTATEYSRAKANALSAWDKAYSNKDKRYNAQFCNLYKNHFLDNEPIPSIDDEYQMMKQIIPMLPLDVLNGLMTELISQTDTNLVVINFNTEKDGVVYPTKEGMLKAIRDVRNETIQPYVDNVKNEPLISQLPKKGSIKSEKTDNKFGYTELTLSNGAKVVLKKTDYKKDQVLVSIEGQGGSSLYGENDFVNLQLFDDAVEASGLGTFSNTELQKALAGKMVSLGMSLSTRRVELNGTTTPNDMETLMQLIYLYFTKINPDNESFASIMKQYELTLQNKSLTPESAFSDSITVTAEGHNPRFTPLTVQSLSKVDYARILQIAKEQTANAAAFTFTIVGNYDENTIRPLIEQYIASLPSAKKVKKGHDVKTRPNGVVVNSFRRKMETPKSIALMIWCNDNMKYSMETSIKADIVGQVLQMIYLKKIREDASAAYSVSAAAGARRLDEKQSVVLQAYCPMKPEKAEEALAIMRQEVKTLAETCDADMLAKVKEYMLKNIADKEKTNGYWAGVIGTWRDYNIDLNSGYKEMVEAQTPQTISAFVKEFIKPDNRIEVVMLPEE